MEVLRKLLLEFHSKFSQEWNDDSSTNYIINSSRSSTIKTPEELLENFMMDFFPVEVPPEIPLGVREKIPLVVSSASLVGVSLRILLVVPPRVLLEVFTEIPLGVSEAVWELYEFFRKKKFNRFKRYIRRCLRISEGRFEKKRKLRVIFIVELHLM